MQRDIVGADPVYWSWAVDGAAYTEADGLPLVNATLNGIENAVGISGSPVFVDMAADLIELFPGAGGPAYYVQGLATELPVGTNIAAAHSLQCAVNELAETPRGVAVVGRMFVGPLGNTDNYLITNPDRLVCVEVMQHVAAAHIAAGYTPVVISRYENKVKRPDPIGIPIVGFRADNRWDILKSRRVDVPDSSDDFPLEPAA